MNRNLGRQFQVPGSVVAAPAPVASAEAGHRQFLSQLGRSFSTQHRDAVRPLPYSERVADAYEAAPLSEERARPHYQALGRDVEQQFDFMTRPRRRGGLGVDVQFQAEDPYQDFAELHHDLTHNNRLKVFRSDTSTGTHVSEHLSEEHNDLFRAVHDYFGHAAAGRGFDRHGERGAYVLHRGMFSPAARPAMFTETEGQNSVFVRHREFPVQKSVILPANLRTTIPILGRRSAMLDAISEARKSNIQIASKIQELGKG